MTKKLTGASRGASTGAGATSRRAFLGAGLALLGTACGRGGKSGALPKGGGSGSGGGGGGGGLGPLGSGAVGKPGLAGDVFGYQAAFDEALAKIGFISPAQLAVRHPAPSYLDELSFDPTKAKFFPELQALPHFKLEAPEAAVYRKHGFVVSERLGAESYAELYYRVFTNDMPVLITADSVLHAWHRSYDAVLEELEERHLYTSVDEILTGMADALPDAHAAYGQGPLAPSVSDADSFIAVARSLLAGKAVATKLSGKGADGWVDATLAAVKALGMREFELFGSTRVIDFSQFKVRGHYENSERLRHYFQAMMWLGRIDLRIGGDNSDANARQLASAVVLHDLLRRSQRFAQWESFDKLLQTFVGRTDSMTFGQLGGLLEAAKITSPAAIADLATLGRLQADIDKGNLGVQQIRSDYFESSPLGPDRAALPRSFTTMGQKFVVDSWATAKLVADDIMWHEAKVQRRMPSALDVAFGVLGNDAAIPLLVRRIVDKNGVAFRDGLPYQHNLAAVRAVIESHPARAWEDNLYMGWLGTLRALSAPTTEAHYPEAMRTQAFAMRTLNTQLASWAQLRHDTILYVKQSYTAGVSCYHPDGFVDARPAFWRACAAMATRAAKLLLASDYPDKALQQQHADFFDRFGATVARLGSIADKQAAHKDLDAAEAKMLTDVVQISHGSGFTHYDGWYPTLFYKGPEDSGKPEPIIADVHTDVPAPMLGDPGGVLHQGVGKVDMMIMAVDCKGAATAYVGPTASHYELASTGVERWSDSEWEKRLADGKAPPRPEWTRGYLVPVPAKK